jgi:hypothetical protein
MGVSEKQVQELIADFPWLLNLNYQRVPELKSKGMEYVVSANQRIDLVLRDSITDRPVIVEFKAVPFYRENIGQILEYRSRLIPELSREDSRLYEVFGNKLTSPILILVVSEIDDEARLACNLSGIEVFEYEKSVSEFTKPEKRRTLEEMTKSLNKGALPATDGRHEHVEKLNQEINELLSEMNLAFRLPKFRYYGGLYYTSLGNFFINRWLFSGQDVSIGLYEDIFRDVFDRVVFLYYSHDIAKLQSFREELLKYRKDRKSVPEIVAYDGDSEFEIQFAVDKKELLDKPNALLKPLFQEYTVVMKKVFGIDVSES